jgi:nitrite reductase/ring-hydroxylating ferredoxin subunit
LRTCRQAAAASSERERAIAVSTATTAYATQRPCLHTGGPVGRGKLAGCVVSCPWHGWQYDVRTGENEFDRALRLETYEVVVEDGEVKVVL